MAEKKVNMSKVDHRKREKSLTEEKLKQNNTKKR